MSDSSDWGAPSATHTLSGLTAQTKALASGATTFARAMTRAFASSVISGKQFDDVLKSLTLKMSDLALKAVFKPVEGALSGVLQGLLSGLSGGSSAALRGASSIKPFAAGGVVSVRPATFR